MSFLPKSNSFKKIRLSSNKENFPPNTLRPILYFKPSFQKNRPLTDQKFKSSKLFQLNKKTKNNKKEEELRNQREGEIGRKVETIMNVKEIGKKENMMEKWRRKEMEEGEISENEGNKDESLRECMSHEGGIKEGKKSKIENKEEVRQTNFLIRKDKRVLFVERIGIRQNDLDKSTKHDDNSKKVYGNLIKWKLGDIIDCGGFSQVYRALDCNSGNVFACKMVPITPATKLKEIQLELEILKRLKHPNILQYLGHEYCFSTLYIYLEYVAGGSVASILAKYGPLPEQTIKHYGRQLLRALAFLHSNGIIHKDVKGANILIGPDGTVKLTDFNSSRRIAVGSKEEIIDTSLIKQKKIMRKDNKQNIPKNFFSSSQRLRRSIQSQLNFNINIEILENIPPISHKSNNNFQNSFRTFFNDHSSNKPIEILTPTKRVILGELTQKNQNYDGKESNTPYKTSETDLRTPSTPPQIFSSPLQGSILWMAPEVLRQKNHGPKSDIWSFGCTLLEMATGFPPWTEVFFDNPVAAIMHIGVGPSIPLIPNHISKELKKVIEGCLRREESERMDVNELIKNSFFNDEE